MEVTACTTTMLKPVYTTPHPLAGEKVPLTVFDRAAFDTFVPTVLVYPAPAPPSNRALKEGLTRAVAAHPHLAGCLAVDD
ncbi:agmatine coumaroyltransferase-1-like [Panicum miliaceum]|uniref:Agmatine coumaroyltransferase-1-like n=1 Tax=Panicum miliaceum TaxID=4540 RepID=A0A3L6RHE9_PANMI|nr:agmatine coumaroyltransferase-1-like [Panicum miliaceum]